MKNLILIRHAKSSWETPMNDFDRPLAQSGIERAKKHAKLLSKEFNINEYKWISSPANRAISTARIFQEYATVDIEENPDLYTFSEMVLSKTINKYLEKNDKLIVFGHNPAFTEYVINYGNYYLDNLPTAGIVNIISDFKHNKLQTKGETQFILTHKKCIDAR